MSQVVKRFVKPWIVMPIVAVVAVGIWWGLSHNGGSSTTSSSLTATVTRGTMARTISASGTVAAAHTDDLSFTSGGTVTSVDVAAGDHVTTGEVLATIDSTDLKAAVATASENLASARAQLSDDTSQGASSDKLAADAASVTTAQDRLDEATENLNGAELVATFDGTVASVDLTVGEQLSASGSGGTTLSGTGSGSGLDANELGSSATGGTSDNARSPGSTGSGSEAGSGGDDASTTNDGSSQSAGTAQIQVLSTGTYTVSLNVASADVAEVKVGQTATVALSSSSDSGSRNGRFQGGFGRFFGSGGASGDTRNAGGTQTTTTLASSLAGTQAQGRVSSVGKVADASSGVATYPVVVTFTGSAGTFQPGATVNATITYERIADALQVPSRAVTTTDSGSTVTVADGTKEATVPVTVGESLDGTTQITGGLHAGQKVVLPTFGFGASRSAGRAGGGSGPGSGASGGEGRSPGGFGFAPGGGNS